MFDDLSRKFPKKADKEEWQKWEDKAIEELWDKTEYLFSRNVDDVNQIHELMKKQRSAPTQVTKMWNKDNTKILTGL